MRGRWKNLTPEELMTRQEKKRGVEERRVVRDAANQKLIRISDWNLVSFYQDELLRIMQPRVYSNMRLLTRHVLRERGIIDCVQSRSRALHTRMRLTDYGATLLDDVLKGIRPDLSVLEARVNEQTEEED